MVDIGDCDGGSAGDKILVIVVVLVIRVTVMVKQHIHAYTDPLSLTVQRQVHGDIRDCNSDEIVVIVVVLVIPVTVMVKQHIHPSLTYTHSAIPTERQVHVAVIRQC